MEDQRRHQLELEELQMKYRDQVILQISDQLTKLSLIHNKYLIENS
jgi:hypothetical protein